MGKAGANQSRDHRRLLEQFADDDEERRFGYDQFGHLLLFEKSDGNSDFEVFGHVAVCWPHGTPSRGLPDAAAIVADGGVGARAAYIEYPDGRLDLLPIRSSSAVDQWSFGYPGGGPGMLANAVAYTLAITDQIPEESVPWARLTDAIDYSDEASLFIRIGDLRRRVVPTEQPT